MCTVNLFLVIRNVEDKLIQYVFKNNIFLAAYVEKQHLKDGGRLLHAMFVTSGFAFVLL